MTRAMPGFTFHITEGTQTQEILVGHKNRSDMSAFFTQRTEFKRNNPNLRPGALLTVTIDDNDYSLLFTHLKSLTDPEGFGLRDAMIEKIYSLKKRLDEISEQRTGNNANLIALGDFNTMGMKYPHGREFDIRGEDEIDRLRERAAAGSRGMKLLDKTEPFTFFNGSSSSIGPSDLDHVLASTEIIFAEFAGSARVKVTGWPQQTTNAKKDKWISDFSDHAFLTFDVMGHRA